MPWHCHAALHKPHSHGICCYDKRRPWHEDVYNLWCADACTCHLPVDAGAQTTRCFLRSKIKSMSHRCSNRHSMHFFRGEVKVCLQLSSKCTIMKKFTIPRMHNAGKWLPLSALRRITKQSATFGRVMKYYLADIWQYRFFEKLRAVTGGVGPSRPTKTCTRLESYNV